MTFAPGASVGVAFRNRAVAAGRVLRSDLACESRMAVVRSRFGSFVATLAASQPISAYALGVSLPIQELLRMGL